MYLLGWRGIGLMLVAGLLVPTVALAQPGFYLTPSFSFAEVYDDNLFFTSSGQEKDFISRFSPGIQAGYRSTPLTLLGRYTSDAEVFAEHTELTQAQARQEASIEFGYRRIPLLTLSVNAVYMETQTAGELNLETGLEAGRVKAHRSSLSPSITYRFNTLTSGTWDYSFSKDEQSGAVTTDTHTTNLVLERQITSQDTGSLGYTFHLFRFSTTDTTTSHAFLPGWTHKVTPLTSFTVRAGPRFSEETVDLDVLALIQHKQEQGELALTYTRSQSTVIGQVGTVNTDSITVAAIYQPLSFLRVRAAPNFYRSRRGTSEAKVYRVDLDMTYQINKWLSFMGSCQFGLQQGRLDSVTGVPELGQEEIHHNLFFLELSVTYPYRVSAFQP